MAFFDDLGKKISQAGQSAVQKTKDITDIAKLNSSISDEKSKIEGLYSEIGKLYVKLYGEAPADAFAGLVSGIKTAEENIVAYQAQIKDIKGIRVCDKCGADVPTGSAFCSACGNAMPVPEQPAGPVCANCGKAIEEGIKFCTGCGTPVEAPAEAAPAANKCPGCGAEVPEGSLFCTSCGTKM